MIPNRVLLLALPALVGACTPDADALALACAKYDESESSTSESPEEDTSGSGEPKTLAEAGITLTYTTGLKPDAGASEFVLGGATEHQHGFAIRRIQVAGVDATSQGFNFSQWTASLKLEALRTMPVDEQGRVSLAVSVTDACGTYVAEPLLATIDVPQFELAIGHPHGADYIPDDGVTEAMLTISADKSGAGSQVRVTAEPDELTFTGLTDQRVTLVAIGEGAQAQVRVSSKQAGAFTLLVRSASALRSKTLTVAAPPRFVPGDLGLSAGEVRNVTVLSDGALHECWATSAPGLAVTLAGADITKAPAADSGDSDAWVLTLVADAILSEGTATVTCRDTFFKENTLTLDLIP